MSAITGVERIVAAWDEHHALTAQALKSAIEALNKEALRRLIRALKSEPAAMARLREAIADPTARLHLYGKHTVLPGRKMGHVTRLLPRG